MPSPPPPSAPPLRARAISNEEPTPTQEESVPTDGRDREGEAMMKELGLHKPGPPLAPDPPDPAD
jgi:hypothetical protein